MTATKWFITGILLTLARTAHAHAHLTGSLPPEGSTGQAPAHIVLTFSEATRITAMSLQREGEEARKVAPLPSATAAQAKIPMPKLAPGQYTLSWRMVGDDGHVTSGTLHFVVVQPSSEAGSGAHNHGT